MPSYDPFSMLLCLVLISKAKSLFHLNSWLWLACSGVRAAAADLVGLGQNRVFRVVAKRTGQCSFTVGGEEGYNVLIRLFPGREFARLCVPCVLCFRESYLGCT